MERTKHEPTRKSNLKASDFYDTGEIGDEDVEIEKEHRRKDETLRKDEDG